MNRHLLLATFATAMLAMAAAPPSYGVSESAYTMEILVDGRSAPEYQTRGTTYVEATRGAEYSVRLTNHTGRRIAVALAVDGLNAIDAKTTTALDASKWIIDPYQSVTIDGWQVSSADARRFFFTTEEHSYGAWLGRTTNLGVVEAVVFTERQPPRPTAVPYTEQRDHAGSAGELPRPRTKNVPIPDPTPDEPEPIREESGSSIDRSDEYAATGIGRRVDNPVRRVRFEEEPQPAASLRIRYEYRPQLLRLGVLPQPPSRNGLDRREHADGFSDSGFAPDPYRK